MTIFVESLFCHFILSTCFCLVHTSYLRLGQSDLNREVPILVGLNVLYVTAMVINWRLFHGDHNGVVTVKQGSTVCAC